jgi:putative transposase
MSRFQKPSHAIWHCQYHVFWMPECRCRILTGAVAYEVEPCIRVCSGQKQCQIQELNVQVDRVPVIAMISPRLSASDYLGLVKGRTAIRAFKEFPQLKIRPYWGRHSWTPGYCGNTVGLDEEKVRRYVQYQEKREKHGEQGKLFQ